MKTLIQILENSNSKLKNAEQNLRKLERLKEYSEELTRIKETIEGFKKTEYKVRESLKSRNLKKKQNDYDYYDPGKYDVAYFYVKSMNDEEIIPNLNFKPSLMTKCAKCKSETPVLMSYTQADDSPEGDSWQAVAFYICCRLKEIKTITSSNRFL